MITVQNLTKKFGSFTAVDQLSFSLETGRTTALVGPNGAGKTTALHMISGLSTPTGGTIEFEEPVADQRQQIGFLPQYPSFFNWMTAKEYLMLAGRLGKKSKKETMLKADALLERVGLSEHAGKKIGGFSGGMKQRLGIAQALIHSPKILLLDEPVSALDPAGRKEVMTLLKELKKEMTILYSTHVLHDAQVLCDDVLMMNRGKKVLFDSIDHVYMKYERPEMVLRADQHLLEWGKSFGERHPDLLIEINENTAVIKGKETAVLRKIILEEALTSQLPLRSLEVGTASLEDVFHEVMK
ncbi:ABC transporter ATP-binding protein [Jeotgalibacillus haloalkalitolerans]|uniref:ABC transporter ATP-binding protein n=1 Tax=Jeotgalibacillus haloalkalitolerans TaxID=3104292 RepID=A0ABU5KHH3_9BACL|nr:ABC transporter ATP-binding protein [Jeotgalibacillus sp. HH7-29]MDZ5710578.1 ABC transporter ATP-binding protein [Jeotgalibacillus sp. HH7-29]